MNWICKPTAGHDIHGQSVVYDEETGKSIAIVYDGSADGSTIAAAPELLEALKELNSAVRLAFLGPKGSVHSGDLSAGNIRRCEDACCEALRLIAKAEGND